MLPDRIIEENTLTRDGDRVAVSVRIPWYRALPLSSVTDVELRIDGLDVERDSVTWTINGSAYGLDDLPPLHDEWWYVLDSAVVEGRLPDLPTGNTHEVMVQIGLYIPYLPAGPDAFIAIREKDTKTMPLREKVGA